MRSLQSYNMKPVKCQLIIIASLCGAVLLWYTLFVGNIEHKMDMFQSYRLLDRKNDTLVDLKHFKYIMNNDSICTTSKDDDYSSIVIVVHTARSNFDQRYAIRNTWGSLKVFKQWYLHLVFLLGTDSKSTTEFETRLMDESKKHGDMVMGNFQDSYRNLTYKHLMAYKWVSTFCPTAEYILKTDDDMFIDVFQVVEVILAELIAANKTYACYNLATLKPIRDPKSKWFVTEELYPEEKYPSYCSGSSYLMKASDAGKIYSVSNKINFFWIDDVFVTGILRDNYYTLINDTSHNHTLEILSLHKRHHLNNKNEIINWCGKGLETGQLNFIFVLLNKHEFVSEMFCIWNKVKLTRYAMNFALDLNVTAPTPKIQSSLLTNVPAIPTAPKYPNMTRHARSIHHSPLKYLLYKWRKPRIETRPRNYFHRI